MASAGPNNGEPTTSGAARKGSRGGNQPNKRRFYQSPYANRKFSTDYYEKPYVFYTINPDAAATGFDPFKCIVNKDKLTSCLPNGWKLYFHDDDTTVLLPEVVLKQLKYYQEYLTGGGPSTVNYSNVYKSSCFDVDVTVIESSSNWKTFSEDLISRPEHTIACLALAMHLQINEMPDITRSRHLMLLTPRIRNLDLPISTIKSLSMEDCGSLVRIRGNIIQSGESSIDWIWRCLACGVCDTKQVVLQRDGRAVMPVSCKGCNHRGKDYSGDLKSHFNVATEIQTLRLQEARTTGSSALNTRNDVPAIIDIVVKGDLVNKVLPGADVLCTGLLKTRVEGDQDRRYFLYVEVVHLQMNEDSDERNFDYSESDIQIVQRIKSEPNKFRCLVQSLCPKIVGQDMVKAALLLGMFSVSPRDYKGRRREAHLLLVGDPGLGKSELLEACSSISPRGVFVSSNSCTNSGLTATMSTDSASKSTVEAGALVMADQGVCCIDELDKITTSMDVLLEAMEDQVVNIAKAGVINKLRAKTSVLAAANPIGGHYNKTKRITENLKIGLPVMSRFDLVLILIDQKNLAVEERFLDRKRMKTTKKEEEINAGDLQSRLKVPADVAFDPLPQSSFQKYLSFVNRNYLPELSKEAKLVIKEQFMKLRNQPFYSDTIPVTTRALLSLIRLTQARAKIDLCQVATKEHALDVIELIEFGMQDVRNITEEDIAIQTNMQSKEPKQSKAKQLSNFTRILQIRAKEARLAIFSKTELKEMALTAGVRNSNEIIELMNVNGVLLKKDTDTYQFVNY